MPDNDKKPTAPVGAFEVEIKNPDKTEASKVKIVPFTPAKGRGQNSVFLYPENLATWDLDKAVDVFGKGPLWKLLVLPAFKRQLNAFTDEAMYNDIVDPKTKKVTGYEVEEDANTIIKDFSEMLSVLSRRGETRAALSQRYNEIVEEMEQVLSQVLAVDPGSEEFLQLRKQGAALKEELNDIRNSLEAKKRKVDRPETEQPLAEQRPMAA